MIQLRTANVATARHNAWIAPIRALVRAALIVGALALLAAAVAGAQTAPSAFPKGRIDPCNDLAITQPQLTGAQPATQYMAAQAYEACGHTWPPGANACRNFLAAGDAYKIAASLTKSTERRGQLLDWLSAQRAYGWANAYCTNPADKARADDGFAEAMVNSQL